MTDLELRPGTPYQPLYRISGSLRPDPLAGIDAWGGTLCLLIFVGSTLGRLIFSTAMSLRRNAKCICLFLSRDEGWKRHSRITFTADTHFSSGLFFLPPLRNFHGPFSLSSMWSLTYQPRVSANPRSSRILSRKLSLVNLFMRILSSAFGLLSAKSILNVLWRAFFSLDRNGFLYRIFINYIKILRLYGIDGQLMVPVKISIACIFLFSDRFIINGVFSRLDRITFRKRLFL